jgi:hypothetical protein
VSRSRNGYWGTATSGPAPNVGVLKGSVTGAIAREATLLCADDIEVLISGRSGSRLTKQPALRDGVNQALVVAFGLIGVRTGETAQRDVKLV